MPEKQTVPVGTENIEVRGLKRREIKQLASEDLSPAAVTLANSEKLYDRVFDLILTPEDIEYLDEQCNADAMAVYRKIMDLTYGRKDEEKNS